MVEDTVMEKSDDTTIGDSIERDESMVTNEVMEGEDMMQKGSYEEYSPEKLALAENGKVVLYFHADWCPICRGLESEILANPAGVPNDVHILRVNYDTSKDLKQKYGVTYQHTFVQVDANGNLLAKWGDATTLAQVLAKVK